MAVPKELWVLPVSPTALLRDPQLGVHRGRRYTLTMRWEGDENDVAVATIDFIKVEAYKVTHHHSLTNEMVSTSYGKLVEMGETEWLQESMLVLRRPSGTKLRHLRISFDDGPCYEFLCSDVEIKIAREPVDPPG